MPAARYVISVVLPDRVGILRDIVGPISDLGAHIDGISQTVTSGYFTAILTATLPAPAEDDIRRVLAAAFAADDAELIVTPYRERRTSPAAAGDRYMVTVAGPDHADLLQRITVFFAEEGVNLDDWYVAFDGPAVTHVGQVTVPAAVDVAGLQRGLHERLAPYGLSASLQHENIFRATNEVGPIKRLWSES